MKLYATLESERGKIVSKAGDDFIRIVLYVQDGSNRNNPVGYLDLQYRNDVEEYGGPESTEEYKPDMNEWTVLFKPREDQYTDWQLINQGHVYPPNAKVNRKR